ncbi:GAF domain-containing protein [Paenibacillus beijingensis]|uniref:GAF domain-containing protein n=1 Tax=Paenibacillus beijingensis TaxID=1126833 RepID=A0A0D5NKC8_9BACL|nr:GAF domain-containing protein [Paenibacillus beijingensis]AJY75383.1 hypothetical protein VN24_13400 [Paenibacillus beijingensis]
MNKISTGQWMTQELERLCLSSDSDFGAFAQPVESDRLMRWTCEAGSRNRRISQMTVKPGVGAAGMALRLGRPYIVNGIGNDSAVRECPVMLAEKLLSAVAMPIPALTGHSAGGVLLLGRRSGLNYGEEDVRLLSAHIPGLLETMRAGLQK